jgi:hypothetical protein
MTVCGGRGGEHTVLTILETGEVLKTRAIQRSEGLPRSYHLSRHCQRTKLSIQIVEINYPLQNRAVQSCFREINQSSNTQSIPSPVGAEQLQDQFLPRRNVVVLLILSVPLINNNHTTQTENREIGGMEHISIPSFPQTEQGSAQRVASPGFLTRQVPVPLSAAVASCNSTR